MQPHAVPPRFGGNLRLGCGAFGRGSGKIRSLGEPLMNFFDTSAGTKVSRIRIVFRIGERGDNSEDFWVEFETATILAELGFNTNVSAAVSFAATS